MPLHLKIENEPSLPDGGPIAITVTSKRGIDIGRDQYLDWVLPDPTRFISGKHCEVRFRDGGYWLTDVSTNGTFVNGGEFRLDGPYALKNGDRIDIGPYIISVAIEADAADAAGQAAGNGGSAIGRVPVWDAADSAPPVDPRSLREPNVQRGLNSSDMLDWVSDIPAPVRAYAPAPAPAPAPPPPAPAVAPPPPAAPVMPPASVKWELTQHPFTLGDGAAGAIPAPARPPAPSEEPPPSPPADIAPSPPQAPEPPPVLAEPEPPAPPKMPRAAPLQPSPQPPRDANLGDREIISRFARGLGMPEDIIAASSVGDLAEQLGVFVRTTADNLKQLQTARAQSKGAMRSANTTMVQALDNNPLRFAPTTEDALRIMFGPKTTSYLDSRRTLESSFNDIKKHQAMVFSAMQTALRQMIEDLDPDRIETTVQADKGVASLLKSRQAKLWEHYRTTWKAKAGASEHGMLDVFMRLFAEAYDRSS